MVEEPTDGSPLVPLSEKHRGFHIVVRCEGTIFIAHVATTLVAGSVKPLRTLEIHEHDLASSMIDARTALEGAKAAIDQLYDLERQMVERGAAHLMVKLPPWVSDEEFLKQRGEA